jgi:lipid-binding SYLF domain-containing protein
LTGAEQSDENACVEHPAQTADLRMLIINDERRSALMRGRFELGADLSAAAGPVSTGQERATDTKFRAPVLTYTR